MITTLLSMGWSWYLKHWQIESPTKFKSVQRGNKSGHNPQCIFNKEHKNFNYIR